MKYSLLLKNGRIIDPRNKIDMYGDLGTSGGVVAEVGPQLASSEAEKVIDLEGRWIVPGVIDPHMHVSSWIGNAPGLKMMAREGVTTALDMAGPPSDVIENVRDYGSGMNIAGLDAFHREESGDSSAGFSDAEIRKKLVSSVEEGALGVKLLGGHYPLSSEITKKVIRFAAEQDVYVAFHAGTLSHGSDLEGLKEAVELADGHRIHIAHINSYCRGSIKKTLYEVQEAVDLLNGAPNVWSESYLSVFNGTSGKCGGGQIHSEVTKRCCRMGGFADDEQGLGEAIKSGYARVVRLQGGENVHVTGAEGYDQWKAQSTDVTVSFPVNASESQFALATMKNKSGNFVVDALCTDGGGIPRNTMVRQGLDLVRFGALTPAEYVRKTSTNAAAMLGLAGKGHLSSGADGDITVIDPKAGKSYIGIARGQIIMIDGVVVGSGGTFITTEKGKAKVERSGVEYVITDTKKALPKRD